MPSKEDRRVYRARKALDYNALGSCPRLRFPVYIYSVILSSADDSIIHNQQNLMLVYLSIGKT